MRKLTVFGQRIEVAQRKRMMTDTEVAAAVGVSAQTLWQWKRRKININMASLRKLNEVLGLDGVQNGKH